MVSELQVGYTLVLFESSMPTRLNKFTLVESLARRGEFLFSQYVEPQLSGRVAAYHAGSPEYKSWGKLLFFIWNNEKGKTTRN